MSLEYIQYSVFTCAEMEEDKETCENVGGDQQDNPQRGPDVAQQWHGSSDQYSVLTARMVRSPHEHVHLLGHSLELRGRSVLYLCTMHS